MPKDFAFINISDPLSDPKPGKSVQIRSHCMQGKNKREDSRRSIRERKRQAKEDQRNQVPAMDPPCSAETNAILPMDSLVSDLALLRFASPDIDAEAKTILFKAIDYNSVTQALPPLDRAVDFDHFENASFTWLFHDTAFLHSVLYASYAINDLLNPHWDGQPGRKTLLHLRKTLSLLQEKMDASETAHQDESVLAVVVNLALLSAVFGDWTAAAVHFAGLQKIVMLRSRGPTHFLFTRPELHFKLDRMDLAYTLSSGLPPFFLLPNPSPSSDPNPRPMLCWTCEIPAPYLPLPPDLYTAQEHWDYRLANVFQDFQYLGLRINVNALKRARHNPKCFQGVLSSLQGRLMRLANHLADPVQELVRLTLLALLTTTFKAPRLKMAYGWVNERVRAAFERVAWDVVDADVSLRTWILMAVAITVSGAEKVWVRRAWREARVGMNWDSVKRGLLRIVWIEIVHDGPGKAAFQKLEDSMFEV